MRLRPRLLTAFMAAACADPPDPGAAGGSGEVELIVAASDWTSSALCTVPGGCRSTADLGKDPQLAATNGRLFFLARDNDLLFEIDPATGAATNRVSVHVDEQRLANPHDVAAAPDGSLFVALYNLPQIAIVRDGRVEESIDLSDYDLPDGNPQAEAIRIVDVGGAPKAFVALERLDDLDPDPRHVLTSKQPSQMLRIDVASRTVESVTELAGRNPFNTMAEAGGALFMAEPGNFDAAGEAFAGIERFDVATGATRILVPEAALGGSVSEVAVTPGCGAAIVAGPEPTVNPTSLVTFDPESGAPSAPILGPTEGYDLWGLAWSADRLYVGDRRARVVRVLSRQPGTCTLAETGRTIPLPQRPVALHAPR